MRPHTRLYLTCAGIAALALGALAPFVLAQARGFDPRLLLRTNLTGDDQKEVIVGMADFAQRATTGRHTHPGDEYGVVLQGTLEIRAEGRAPIRVKAGEAFHNIKGVIHETQNVGDGTARVASTFVLDRGKPLSQIAGRCGEAGIGIEEVNQGKVGDGSDAGEPRARCASSGTPVRR